jgi:hypothetical protein
LWYNENMPEDDAAARAARRNAWPIRRFELGHEPTEDLSAVTTADERLAMMWQLALDAWAAAGHSLPTYARSEMPGRIYRKP